MGNGKGLIVINNDWGQLLFNIPVDVGLNPGVKFSIQVWNSVPGEEIALLIFDALGMTFQIRKQKVIPGYKWL
jgi:hypothetical protein